MFERVRYRTDPDWYEYRLTERAIDLYPVDHRADALADRHLAGPEGAPIAAAPQRSCGAIADPYLDMPTTAAGAIECSATSRPERVRRVPRAGDLASQALLLAIPVAARLHALGLTRHLRVVGWIRHVAAPLRLVELEQRLE